MTNLTDKVLNELREKDVHPVPAWRFVMRSVLTWIGFAVFVFLGAHSVSIILFLLSDHDWSQLSFFRGGPLGYVFTVLPYVWIAALAALIVVAYLDFRKTKGGYRYRPFMVVGSVIAISLVGGIGLHIVGLGKFADAMLEGNLPRYRMMVPRGIQIWDNPEAGRLVGEIELLHEDGSFELVSPDGQTWDVQIMPDQNGWAPPNMMEGMPVRIIGERDESGEFRAKAVLPWRPGIGPRPTPQNQQMMDREENDGQMRSTGERRMRPSVHPVELLEDSISNYQTNE